MRFEEAARRLRVRPPELPSPPAALAPFVRGPQGGFLSVDEIAGEPLVPGVGLAGGRDREAKAREAAVLVLLFPGPDDEAYVLLMERPEGDLRHAGEVSFPGGVVEPADTSAAAAALREAQEEVGLDAGQAGIEVLGLLSAVVVRVSSFRITPVLALADRRPFVEANAREVAAILEVPVAAFLPDAPIEIVDAERGGYQLRFGAYPVAGYRIWGATARILGQLGATLGSGAEADWKAPDPA